MARAKYETKIIKIANELTRETAKQVILNMPLDPHNPLEVVVRESQRGRKLDQNALMWVGPLKDIEEQAYFQGRQFSAEVWHHYFKTQYLPEFHIEGITKDGYEKWDDMPNGERVLIGSTTKLTPYGFSLHLEQVYAFGANLGVLFSANEQMQSFA